MSEEDAWKTVGDAEERRGGTVAAKSHEFAMFVRTSSR